MPQYYTLDFYAAYQFAKHYRGFIDLRNIQAKVKGGELIVKLPFNQLANGYHKKIKTRED